MLIDMHSQVVQLTEKQYDRDEVVLRILKSAASDGITHIIATPHYQKDRFVIKEKAIGNEVKKLNEQLLELKIPLTVFEGMEITLYEKIAQDIKHNLLPLAGSDKYVLIRFEEDQLSSYALNTFFEMQLMGYIPIIANVEQNKYFAKNPKKLIEYIDNGALIHVGAASILGMNGRSTCKRALRLCRNNLVHLVSSVSSNNENGPSLLKLAYENLRITLSDNAVEYFNRNAENVMNGIDFHVQQSSKKRRY